MAQAVHLQQQRKDLELVFSLQSHYKHFFKNYGVIVGVYDIPSITMQWESFKSYLLKNSGLLFDNSPPITQSSPSTPNTSLQLLTNDVHIRYVNTSGIELPINTQEDFQYALYTFRERARTGEINHLKLTRTKGVVATTPAIVVANPVKMSSNTECDDIFELDADDRSVNNGHPLCVRNELSTGSGGDGLLMTDGDEKAPEWFAMYMQQFKQDIIQEITKVSMAQMSNNLKKMQAANHVVCPKRRQNKSEHYKRRPKMTYANNIAAMENTSCDNTDINTIATTPIIANPQKHSPSLSKVAAVQQPPKSEIINKQIKLKAKRLVASNINVRGSSDSDTLTVMKTTHASNASKKNGNCKRRDKGFNFKQFVVQRMDQSSHKPFIDEEESQATLEVYHESPSPPDNQLKIEQSIAKSTEVLEANSFKIENEMLDNTVYVEGILAAKVMGEERMVSTVSENGVNQDVYMQTWRVENSGTKSWDSNTELQFGWGSIVPLDTTVPCPHLKPGESGCVSVFYKIPGDIGTYECYCHLLHHGRRFGPFLGFKATVTPATNSHQHPRTVITSIRQPQLPTNMTMSAVLSNHYCNQSKPADDHQAPELCSPDNERTSAVMAAMQRTVSVPRECRDMLRAQGRCGGEGKAVIDDYGDNDVVAVIQGVVVREGDVMLGRNYGDGREQQWSGSFKRFKSSDKKKRSTDEKKTHLIKAEDGDIRFINESQQKGFNLMQVAQNHPYCDYDSDSDYDDIDYYPDYFCNDKSIVKESLVKHKHQLQDNSDSDNASIISIADSNRDDGLLGNVSAAATIAGSFSSGTGSASEEFVVIPMPKRTASITLFDCEDENDSCPELELESECAALTNADEKIPEGVKREIKNVNKPEELAEQYTDGLPDSMTVALASALVRLQQKKLAEQNQSLDSKKQAYLKRLDETFIALTNNIDHHIVQATPPTVAKSNDKKVFVNGKTNDSSYGKEWFFEQQTCPVDLSTHSMKVESDVEQKNCNETTTKNKPHCAASLCDLCTNIITKNRLFVFPEDSPGFEVFSSITKNSNRKEDLKTTQDVSTVSETRESLYKKMRAEDIGSSPCSPFEPAENDNTIVQKTGNTYFLVESPAIQQNNPISTQNPTNTSTVCDYLYPQTSTPKQEQIAECNSKQFNPCMFTSSLHLMNRGKETFSNSCSSSNDRTSYVCPSCQCEGLCGRYQDQNESDDRNCVETKMPKNADEIRSQMRDLFVQLAELEPMKDPYLTKVQKKGKFTEDNGKSAASKIAQTMEGEAVKLIDSVLCEDQLADFRNKIPQVQDSSSETDKVPLFMQRQLNDRKPASKRSKFAKTFPPQNVSVTVAGLSPDQVSIDEGDVKPEYVKTLAEQVQANLRLADLDEPMPDVATDATFVAAQGEQQEPVRDVCSTWGVSHAECPFKTHLFQEHEEHGERPIVAPTQSNVAKLIDVPTPEGSFIEGATAPIENVSEQAINKRRTEWMLLMEQERFIELHCKEDTVLGDSMRTLIEMGFTNFYMNLQLLKSNNNEILLALEKLLPNFTM